MTQKAQKPTKKAGKYKRGIWQPAEEHPYKQAIEDAEKYLEIKKLAQENFRMKAQIKSNSQKIAVLMGIGEKYGKELQ